MKIVHLLFLVLLVSSKCFSQINIADSSVQVIAFWNKGERQNYSLSIDKYSVSGKDTSAHKIISYQVDVLVKDSLSKSYILEWSFKNYSASGVTDWERMLFSYKEGLKILIRTNEFGAIKEIINWKAIKDSIGIRLSYIEKQLVNVPELDEELIKIVSIVSSQKSLENFAFKELQLYHLLYSSKYRLKDTATSFIKIPDERSEFPIQAEMSVFISEIDTLSSSTIFEVSKIIDSQNLPKQKLKGAIVERTVFDIHSLSGWLLVLLNRRWVDDGLKLNIEEISIELN